MRRGFWFVAGASAGVYVMVRARRAAESFTPDGLRDRMAGFGVGAHLFADEVRAGMVERETELRERLGLGVHGALELTPPVDPDDTARRLAPAPPTPKSMEGTN
jgi:hypothetical protein